MLPMFVTFEVLKLLKSILANAWHPSNIPHIVVTFDVLKLLTSMLLREEQP